MARRSRNLAGLAALGALGVMASRGLYKKPGEALAPVEYRGTDRPPEMPRAPAAASAAAPSAASAGKRVDPTTFEGYGVNEVGAGSGSRQPQETFMGIDYTGPYDDTGGEGRVNVTAADQSKLGPIVPAAVVPAAAAAAAGSRPRPAFVADDSQRKANAAADAMFENRAPVIGPRSGGTGGATAADMAALERQRAAEANRARGKNRAPTVGPRSTGTGGATARELEAYRRQQEQLARRGRGFNTSRFKEGGAVKASPKKMASDKVSTASKRADGIAQRGKTKCKMY